MLHRCSVPVILDPSLALIYFQLFIRMRVLVVVETKRDTPYITAFFLSVCLALKRSNMCGHNYIETLGECTHAIGL